MDFSKLLSQIDSVTTTTRKNDEDDGQFFRLTVDQAGNASAVIHFLPDANVDEIPFVRRFKHSFKNPANNRWYIEFSLSTIGEQDHIGEVNSELWNSGVEANKEIARQQKRKLEFISNIYVEKDSGNPENNGKVFKFRFGKKIFDKIVAATKADEELGTEPINPFDPMKGASFVLKQKKVADYPNYDESKFGPAKPMFGGDQEKIDEVLAKCYNLQEEIAPSKFKSKEELKKKYEWVMGIGGGKSTPAQNAPAADPELDALVAEAEKSQPKNEEKKQKSPPLPTASASDDDDDAFFKSLMD